MEDPVGASNFSFSNENWLSAGYIASQENTGVGLSSDFWIGPPSVLESELGFFNQRHAFWSCANKMMSVLLPLADFHEDHGIRPHSLKVTTIAVIMVGELSKERKTCLN